MIAFLPLAVLAGALSFSSPCCLPLIPSYLAYISGLPVSDLGRQEARRVTLRAALLFVAGFTVVFTSLGVFVGLLGGQVTARIPAVTRVAGVGMVLLGLATMGILRLPFLLREKRLDLARLPRGPRAAFLVGMAFAFGWVPCYGFVLAAIFGWAAASETALWGGLLLAFYSVGLGLPFVALALAFNRARSSLQWLRRNGRRIELTGGAMLIGVGVLFATGAWNRFFVPLQRAFGRLGWPPI